MNTSTLANPMRSFILVPFIAATAAAAHAQQQVPTKTLAKPDVEYAEPFSQLTSLRELRDGRLVASDMRDKTLQLVDIAGKRATPIGRSGGGPGEWILPAKVFPYPGDSTLVFDIGNTRYLMVAPDGKPARVFNPMGDLPDGGGRGGARGGARGGGAVLMGLTVPRSVDARGRIYSQGMAIAFDQEKGTITSADSAPILRYDVVSKKTDTVAYINLAKNNVSGTARSSGGGQEQMIRIGGAPPYAPADDWTVLADGRVAIARVADYHLEIVQPGGRRITGQPVRYTPVRVSDDEKQEWRDAQYAGVSRTTLELLKYWRREGRQHRLFFAQIEAADAKLAALRLDLPVGGKDPFAAHRVEHPAHQVGPSPRRREQRIADRPDGVALRSR